MKTLRKTRVRALTVSSSILRVLLYLIAIFAANSAWAAAPTITNFSPASGPIGTTVTITGTNFSTTIASDTVKFHGTTASITSATTTQIVAVVPAGTTTGTIAVTVGTAGTATSSSSFTVTTPTITSFTPGSAGIGASVTITGTNYSTTPANNIVKFNGTQATVTSATATQLITTVPTGTTTGKITVVVLSSPAATSSATFTLLLNPTITSFTPTSGGVGTSVTITGTNFSATKANDTIKFNGTLATVTSATATQLVAAVPTGATTGTISVAVANVPTVATSSATFTVIPPPTISGFSPTSGPIGTTVTITGTNFVATPLTSNTVKFNGKQATVSSASTTQLVVTVPTGTTSGAVTVTVSNMTATGASYTVTTPPTITSFSPLNGAVGTTVTVVGTNYSATAINDSMSFNGVSATISTATTTHLTALVPDTATTGPISVSVVGGGSVTSTTNYTVTTPPLAITSYSASSGLIGSSVSINGTGFSVHAANDAVSFSGTNAIITSASPTKLVVTIPDADSGPISVTVAGQTVSGSYFSVQQPPPTVTSFSPMSGPAGSTIVVNGTWFNTYAPNDTVIFNGLVGVHPDSATRTQLVVVVPPTATTGLISVNTGNGTPQSPTAFTVTSPYISSIAPTSGASGTVVTVNGANFDPTSADNEVTFVDLDSSVATALVTAATPTKLTVTVPDGMRAGDFYQLVVSDENGSGTFESFESVAGVPTITGFGPSGGPVGTAVVINGKNFGTSSKTVSFNGTQATIASSTPTQIAATVPAGSSTGPISVTVGGQVATSATNFSVVTQAPVITSFSPTGGPRYTTITVMGQNFSPIISNNVATISGVPILLSAASATSLTGIVGWYGTAPLSTAPVQVVTGGQTGVSSASFLVSTAAPTIGSFTPTTGPAGSQVVISGQNFVNTPAFDKVTFAGVQATVNSATPTQLIATVPAAATSGPIAVLVHDGAVTTSTNFTVTGAPAGDVLLFSPASGPVGTVVKLVGFDGTTYGPSAAILFNGVASTNVYYDFSSVNGYTSDISAVVPAGATSGPIKLYEWSPQQNKYLTAQSSSNFNVTNQTADVLVSSLTPEPSQVGQAYTVQVSVTPNPPANTTPTGYIVISDGTNACTIALPAVSCALTGTAVGIATLTATYSGDVNYASGVGTTSHVVNPTTPTEICGFDPWATPNDPPGFVALTQLSGAVYSPGFSSTVLGATNLSIVSTSLDGCIAPGACAGYNHDIFGTYVGPANTGFVANGIVGFASGGKFLIPQGADSGPAIVLTASTLDGQTAGGGYYTSPSPSDVHMIPNVKFATAPATVTFSFDTENVVVQSVTLTYGIPIGIFNLLSVTNNSLASAGAPTSVTYTAPGMYTYNLTVTDAQGLQHVDQGQILIGSQSEQQAIACDVFSYLKDRLNAQDAPGAANVFTWEVQPGYFTFFNNLGTNMPVVAHQLGNIGNGYIGPSNADLMLVRDNANQTRSGYPLRLTRGADGKSINDPYIKSFFSRPLSNTDFPDVPISPLGQQYQKAIFATPTRYFTTRLASDSPSTLPDGRYGMADYSNRGFFTSGTMPGFNSVFSAHYLEPGDPATAGGYTYSATQPCIALANADTRVQSTTTCGHWEHSVEEALPGSTYADTLPAGFTMPNVPVASVSIFSDPSIAVGLSLANVPGYAMGLEELQASANLNIPRAIGYAAGMLDFFFRGSIEVDAPADGLIAINDDSQPHSVNGAGYPCVGTGDQPDPCPVYGFTRVRLNIRNNTPDLIETVDGSQPIKQLFADTVADESGVNSPPYQNTLVAVARYHRNPCYQSDLSGEYAVDPQGNPIQRNCPNGIRTDFQEISVSAPLVAAAATLNSDTASPQIFDFSADPIPVNATDLFIQVVYRGLLGQEVDGIAVGTLDVAEPNYFTYWNNTDYFLYYGQWITPAVAAQDGETTTGPLPISDIQVCFSTSLVFVTATASFPPLAQAQFIRLAILTTPGAHTMGFMSTWNNTDELFSQSINTVVRQANEESDLQTSYTYTETYLPQGRGIVLGTWRDMSYLDDPNATLPTQPYVNLNTPLTGPVAGTLYDFGNTQSYCQP